MRAEREGLWSVIPARPVATLSLWRGRNLEWRRHLSVPHKLFLGIALKFVFIESFLISSLEFAPYSE